MGTRLRMASGFVIGQVALSLVLVTGGGLLIRTYANLATMDLGFDPGGVLIVDVGTRKAGIAPASRIMIFERVQQAAEAVPGVTGAAIADISPVTGGAMAGDVEVRGRIVGGTQETFINRISPGWLSLYRTSILTGRDFTNTDRPGSLPVAIVNRAFVRKFLGGADPLGHVVRQVQGPPGRPPMEWTVVGVTADAVYDSLRAAAPPTMYIVFGQIDDDLLAMGAAPASASLSVRVVGRNPQTLSRSIAAAIANVNPDLDLTFRPLPAIVSGSLTIERALALLSGLFSGLSLLLAAIGLYGVTSYEVTRRRTEIGIRMALGATRGRVVREVLSRVLVLVGTGVVIGAGASVWASQFVTALLYGLKSRDPLTLVGAVVVLIAVGVLAGWLPARRAARLDPMVALRCE
jgi:predicted permease